MATKKFTFEELERDLEQGLKTLSLCIQRSRESGRADEQSEWALSRCKNTLSQLRQFSTSETNSKLNDLTGETARLDKELRDVLRTLLLPPSTLRTSETHTTNNLVDSRTRLLRGNQTLDETTGLIREMGWQVEEANQIGVATLEQMGEQGGEMQTARTNLLESEVTANSTGQVLRRMAKRAFYNRLFLICVALLLLAADITFCWYGFIKK